MRGPATGTTGCKVSFSTSFARSCVTTSTIRRSATFGSSRPCCPSTRIHFVLSRDEGAQTRGVERALERATPFLRARLADAIEIKRIPDLRFVFDGVTSPDDGGS
jgi:hypothetical protein